MWRSSSELSQSGSVCFCADSLCFVVWETPPYIFLPSLFSDLPPAHFPHLLSFTYSLVAECLCLGFRRLPLLLGIEFLAVVCMSGAGSFWTVERLPVPFTCARAGGDGGDSPLVWGRAAFSLGTIDIWGWIFLFCEGHPVTRAANPPDAHSPSSLPTVAPGKNTSILSSVCVRDILALSIPVFFSPSPFRLHSLNRSSPPQPSQNIRVN